MNFTFYNRQDYFKQLVKDIDAAKPGERVLVATISLDPHDLLVAQVLHSLAGAAQRGAHVLVMVDAYTFLQNPNKLPGPLWYNLTLTERMSQPFAKAYQMLKHIEQCGGSVVITNRPNRRFSTMHAGRSHIKAAIIGNRLYIGGCNLSGSDQIDLMTHSENAKAADWVYQQLSFVAHTGSTKAAFKAQDQRFEVDKSTSILIDAGRPRQSRILDEALHLIDTAEKSLLITCQYFPGGVTAKHLATAFRRGVDVTIYHSHPKVHGLEAPAHHVQQFVGRSRLPAKLKSFRLAKGAPKLHAKVLVSEKEAIVGSHNFITQGVTLGTAEIALHVKGPAFTAELRKFIENEITSRLPAKRSRANRRSKLA